MAASDIGTLLEEHAKRIYKLEQGSTTPGNYPTSNKFEEIFIGPVGDRTRVAVDVDPPTDLVVTTGAYEEDSYADVSWTPPAGDNWSHFEVTLVEVNGTSRVPVEVKRVYDTDVRYTNLIPGKTYGIKVASVNRLGFRTQSPLPGPGQGDYHEFAAPVDQTTPDQVTGLTVSVGVKSMVVRWDESPNVDVKQGRGLYQVQIAKDTAFTDIVRSELVSATLMSVSDLDRHQLYRVRVRAIDDSGNEGPWSATVSTQPAGVNGGDIVGASVTADHAIFAEAAVVDADIANLSADKLKANTGDFGFLKATASLFTHVTIASNGSLRVGDATNGLYVDTSGIRMWQAGELKVHIPAGGDPFFSGTVSASNITGSTLTSTTGTGATMQELLVSSGQITFNYGTSPKEELGSIYAHPAIDYQGWITFPGIQIKAGQRPQSPVISLFSSTLNDVELAVIGIEANDIEFSTMRGSTPRPGGDAEFYISQDISMERITNHPTQGIIRSEFVLWESSYAEKSDMLLRSNAEIELHAKQAMYLQGGGAENYSTQAISVRLGKTFSSNPHTYAMYRGSSQFVQGVFSNGDIVFVNGSVGNVNFDMIAGSGYGVGIVNAPTSPTTSNALGQVRMACYYNAALVVNRTGNHGSALDIRQAGQLVGWIHVTGSSASYNSISDYRAKKDWKPIDDAIDRVMKLKPYRGYFADEPETPVDYFLAHEVSDVAPYAVTGDKDQVDENGIPVMQAMDNSKLIPLMAAAQKRSVEMIVKLQKQVSELQDQLGNLVN